MAWSDADFACAEGVITYIHWDGEDWACADGSIYNPRKKLPDPALISRLDDNSHTPVMDVDNDSNVHIAWLSFVSTGSDANNDLELNVGIFYLKKVGNQLSCIDGSEYDPDDKSNDNPALIFHSDSVATSRISMDIDSSGNPHFVCPMIRFLNEPYRQGLVYFYWDG